MSWFTRKQSEAPLPLPIAPEQRPDRRDKVLKEWEADRARRVADLGRRRAAVEAADALTDACRLSLRQLEATAYGLAEEYRAENHQLNQVNVTAEKALRELRDPAIDAFVNEVDKITAELPRHITTSEGMDPPDAEGRCRRYYKSNHEAINLITLAIGAARTRAYELQFERVTDLAASLDELRHSIPSVAEAEATIAGQRKAS